MIRSSGAIQAIILFLLPVMLHAQDTLVRFDGTRILAYDLHPGKMKFRYFDSTRGRERRIDKQQIYFIRYKDGSFWPEDIGIWRQRRYRKTVLRSTGDTALANELFPRRRSAYDSITTMRDERILALNTKLHIHSIRFTDAVSLRERRLPTSAVYRVRFASGRDWPPKIGKTHAREYARGRAAKSGDWSTYERKYSSARNQLLFCAPGLHQSGEVPGISVGLAFDCFVDSARHVSLGAGVTRMWAGTLAGGEYSNGERRTNVQSLHVSPGIRYHLGDRRSSVDPFVGINVTLGSYRRYDEWMFREQLYRDVPSSYLMVAPQLELGVNLIAANRFTSQFAIAGGPQFTGGHPEGVFATLGLIRLGFRF